MGNQNNCSVVFTLFNVTFLGKWDECRERPFLWTLTSFEIATHILCILSSVVSPPVLTSSLGRHQDLWLCDLLSDGSHEQPLNEVVQTVSPNILVQF